MQPQKILIYGTRSSPLSFFLSRKLNIWLGAKNIYCVDTPVTRAQNRLLPIRDVFGCNELPDLTDAAALESIITENQITDVIDMTNTPFIKAEEEGTVQDLKHLPENVKLFTPIFTTPLDIRKQKAASKEGNRRPILPGIVYPFQLTDYRFPCDLGTYLFWENYKSAELKLDCKEIRIHSG